jgi:hypothetical protein
MTFDPSQYLTTAQRIRILEQRIHQWAVEAYERQLSLDALVANDPKARTPEQANATIDEQDAAMDILGTAIEMAQTKLDELAATAPAGLVEQQMEKPVDIIPVEQPKG